LSFWDGFGWQKNLSGAMKREEINEKRRDDIFGVVKKIGA
jgi:hypothetical protein